MLLRLSQQITKSYYKLQLFDSQRVFRNIVIVVIIIVIIIMLFLKYLLNSQL